MPDEDGSEPDRVISGLGGTGSGTGMVGGGLLAGPETTVGKILLLASPATSVVVGSCLFYLHVDINRRLEARAAKRARKTLEQAIRNPLLPEDSRAEFQRQLSEFEQGVVARELERVKVLGSVPDRDQP